MTGNVLQISFVIGFAFALAIYIIACFAGKKTPQLRSSVLVIGCIVFAVALWPFPWSFPSGQVIRFGIMYFVCLGLITSIIKSFGTLLSGLYPVTDLESRVNTTNKVVTGLAILFFILVAVLFSPEAISVAYRMVVTLLFACLGLLLALKLLKR